jgi:S1-C subfamily serine protease
MRNNQPKYKLLPLAITLVITTLACGVITPVSVSVATKPPNIVTPQLQKTGAGIVAPIPPIATTIPSQLPELTSNEEALLINLYQRVNPAVVNIIIYISSEGLGQAAGQGSGFVYDTEGHIVTNSHVVHGADEINVVFSDGSTYTATLTGEDLHSDLAVIKVDTLPENVQPLPLADINKVAVGQTVAAIGNPFGLGGTLTKGIVSAMGRSIPALTAFQIPQAIQTDAPINPGNSGGPLLNLQGQVIGVNAQIETGDGSRVNSGVGFAIPVSIVARVVPVLIKDGEYQWGWLGVVGGSVNAALVKAMGLPVNKGAYVSQVVSGGPADKAGLRGSTRQTTVNGRTIEVGGDVIVAIDGVPVTAFEDILSYIALSATPGQEVTLTIIRNGNSQDVKLVLEPRPQDASGILPIPTP